MNKAFVVVLISLAALVPVLASAKTAPKPVKDTTPPVIATHTDVKVSVNGVSGATATYTKPTATDNVSGSVAVSCTPASGTYFALGATTVTCTAKDAANNVATKTFKVIVEDTTRPVITVTNIASNGANPARAKAGDTVTLTFTTNEPVYTPVVVVNSRALLMHSVGSETAWQASYTVQAKDPAGKVAYIVTALDKAKNLSACSSVPLPLVGDCPPANGSSVTIYKDTTVPPPTDTQAPVIAAHDNVYATTTDTSATVSYTTPSATDNVDASVALSCTPASGSVFALGTTTITCSAADAAGNASASTFLVVVTQEVAVPPAPTPYTMASQDDESYLCGETNQSWRYCDDAATFSFTDSSDSGIATVDLGIGSTMGDGTIQTVTIAKDPSPQYGEINVFHPWDITVSCYTDASHTAACDDWSPISDDANESSDGKYWNADFSALNRAFNQAEYYVMTINDKDYETPVFGSQSLQEPYWVIKGLR